MATLERLSLEHAAGVLELELANRAYFATSISDRGDAFFTRFDEHLATLLSDQEAGTGAYHVLVREDGAVLGRFNLVFVGHGVAELGYRVAEHAAGRGVATAAVRQLCAWASSRYGLGRLRAATSAQNVASQRVLVKAGFAAVGPADPSCLGGKTGGTWYERVLSDEGRRPS